MLLLRILRFVLYRYCMSIVLCLYYIAFLFVLYCIGTVDLYYIVSVLCFYCIFIVDL